MKLTMVLLSVMFAGNFALPSGILDGTLKLDNGFPDSGKKVANLESKSQESVFIKFDDAYGNVQKKASDFFQLKPLTDSIREDEKFGNTGLLSSASVKFVDGVEVVSNLVNSKFEIPADAIKSVSKSLTNSLNLFGGRLIGL